MRRILILHPEGNINNNPNLLGIVEMISEEGYYIDIFSKVRRNILQICPTKNTKLYLEDCDEIEESATQFAHKYFTAYVCVIGVDLGIIEASKIAKFQNIPLGYISYEIFFTDETSYSEKCLEIEACKNIDFAIVQDKVRGKHLSEQNEIHEGKFIYIPVAGRKIYPRTPNKYLHNKLGIPEKKKIIIISGSIDSWALPDSVLGDLTKWSKDWVFVLHNRYGRADLHRKYFNYSNKHSNLYLSFEKIETTHELNLILNSCNAGLALYRPSYESKYTGKNIEFIGLSSGKVSSYIANGIPVITNITKPLSTLHNKYNFGINISKFSEIPNALNKITASPKDCYKFFFSELDLSKKIIPLINKLNNYKNNTNTFDSIIQKQLISFILEDIKIKKYKADLNDLHNSKEYKLGRFIFTPIRIINTIRYKVNKIRKKINQSS